MFAGLPLQAAGFCGLVWIDSTRCDSRLVDGLRSGQSCGNSTWQNPFRIPVIRMLFDEASGK